MSDSSDLTSEDSDVSSDDQIVSVVPYAHEPPPQAGQPHHKKKKVCEGYPERTGNNWCQCGGQCDPQDNPVNRFCCQEQSKIREKIDSWTGELQCITEHPGYKSITEDVFVLEVAYLEYKSRYQAIEAPLDRKYRYCAYRQFIRWIFKKMGKDNRQPLPSCVMKRVKEIFPSIDGLYTGFSYAPDL